MKDLIINAMKEGVQEARDNAKMELFFKGYDEATDTCVAVITEKIEALHKQINDGKFLSNQEQFLLAQLNELKKEIEHRLRNVSDLSI